MADDTLVPVDGTPNFVEGAPQVIANKPPPRDSDAAGFYRAGQPVSIAKPQSDEWASFKAGIQQQLAVANIVLLAIK